MKITAGNADHLVAQALLAGKSLLHDTMQAAEDQLWILRKQGAAPASDKLYNEELPRVQQHEQLTSYLAASREGATFPLGRKAQVAVFVWCKLWNAHRSYIRECAALAS